MEEGKDLYQRELESRVRRLEAIALELQKPLQTPAIGLWFRVRSNGAGNFNWKGGHWEKL